MKSIETFLDSADKDGINLKSALMEWAAISRNLQVERVSDEVIHVKNGSDKPLSFHLMNGPHSSVVGMFLCDNKDQSRKLLKNSGINVTHSGVFNFNDLEVAVAWLNENLAFPVVVKPSNSAQGRGVTTDIKSTDSFRKAWKRTFFKNRSIPEKILLKGIEMAWRWNVAPQGTPELPRVLVEEHRTGSDFRVFVVNGSVISVTQRKRANISGDGKSTVSELIEQKNRERLKNPYLKKCLIPKKIEALDLLVKNGMDLTSVPKAGETVTLRNVSNLSAGGDSIDFTETAHPEFLKIAVQAVNAIPGMQYAGVDIITDDITAEPNSTNYVVGEIEYSPAPLSHFPAIGKPRDMAGAILDYYLT